MNELDPNTKPFSFGTEPHKLHRKDAPDTSVAAAHKVDTATDEEKVYKIICGYPKGLTLKDLAFIMNKQNNAISGRITALLQKNMVEDSGDRRDGCRVIRQIKHV